MKYVVGAEPHKGQAGTNQFAFAQSNWTFLFLWVFHLFFSLPLAKKKV